MALFTAIAPFGPQSFNLNYMWNRTSDTIFQNNTFESFDGVTYTDNFSYNWFGPKRALTTTVTGPTLTVDDSGSLPVLTGGTMTGLFEFSYKLATPVLRFSLQDFTADAADFVAASQTLTRVDDRGFFAGIFSGADTVELSGFNDVFRGYGGNDHILGNLGNDQLSGNRGGDRIEGGGGHDTLLGNQGGDRLLGQFGNDVLNGGLGRDTIFGGRGGDRLIGGANKDWLYAGNDNVRDTFVYKRASDSSTGDAARDEIRQFDSGEDKINLTQVDADTSVVGNQTLALSVSGPAANSVWLAANGSTIFVRADVDGDALADFEIEFVGLLSMHSSDLIL